MANWLDKTIKETMDAYIQAVVARNGSPKNTQQTVFKLALFERFCGYFNYTKLNQVTAEIVNDFLISYQKPNKANAEHITALKMWMPEEKRNREYKEQYIHGIYRVINAWINWLVEKDHLSAKPKFETPSEGKGDLKRATRPHEMNKILDSCVTMRDRIMILLFADSGIRRWEACNLRWCSFIYPEGYLALEVVKGHRARKVVLGETTKKMLYSYREVSRLKDGTLPEYMFNTEDGYKLAESSISSLFWRLEIRINTLEDGTILDKNAENYIEITPHKLRRLFAAQSIIAGESIDWLATQLGHKDINTTKEYLEGLQDYVNLDLSSHSPIDRLVSGGNIKKGFVKRRRERRNNPSMKRDNVKARRDPALIADKVNNTQKVNTGARP